MKRPKSELLRPWQAAQYLGISLKTFRRWIQAGAQIPCVLSGKRRRYVVERLEDWKMNRDRRVA